MAFGNAKVIAEMNPVFGFLSNQQMLFAAAGLEIAAAAWLLIPRLRQRLGIGMIAWLGTLFLGYRFLLWNSGFKGYCDCLGSLTDTLRLSEQQAEWVAGGILLYFLLGSYGILLTRQLSKVSFKKRLNVGVLPAPQG